MTPRERFRTSSNANGWNDVVDSAQFVAAADAAMLHFSTVRLSSTSSIDDAAANEYRRQGAVAFLDTLINLNTQNEPRQTITSGNLRTS